MKPEDRHALAQSLRELAAALRNEPDPARAALELDYLATRVEVGDRKPQPRARRAPTRPLCTVCGGSGEGCCEFGRDR